MRSAESRHNTEWPTVALLLGCYIAFGIATWFWQSLPLWALLPIGGYIVALHGGLQHENIHGHPTHWPLLNEMLVSPSLFLWVPYRRYRTLHLRHHNNARLTDPFDDPESFYMDPQRWERLPEPVKKLLVFNNTLLGRLTAGVLVNVSLFLWHEARLIKRGDREVILDWLLHLPAAALVLFWVVHLCGMPFWLYVLCFAYPGTALILLRSFAEHRAHEDVAGRTLVLEASKPLSLLYLCNNLHSAHHERPDLAWYRLPAYYAEHKTRLLDGNGHYFISGYAKLAARYLLKPKESVAHPYAKPSQPAASRPAN